MHKERRRKDLAAAAHLFAEANPKSRTHRIFKRIQSHGFESLTLSERASLENLLDNLTREFYKCAEPVAELLDAYIERHPEEFPT